MDKMFVVKVLRQIVTISMLCGLVFTNLPQPAVAQTSPALPLNHRLADAPVIASLTTLPTNYDFTTTAITLDPTITLPNATFAAGLTGWTPSNTTLVQVVDDTNSTNGSHLFLNGQNQWALSDAFTVPATAQSIHFLYANWALRNANEQSRLFVEVFRGPNFDTATMIGVSSGSQQQGWQQALFDVQAYQGQTIKLRFRVDDDWDRGGRSRIDDLSFRIDVPSWQASDTSRVQLRDDEFSVQQAYLLLNGQNQWALSSAFTIPTDAQSLRLMYAAWATRNATEQSRLFVEIFSGTDYATYTLVTALQAAEVDGWKPAIVDVQRFQGQSIKLRLRVDDDWERGGRARIDMLRLITEVPGWTPSDSSRVHLDRSRTPQAGSSIDLMHGVAQVITDTASYPLNRDFATPSTALASSSYPTNSDFSAGLTAWTPSNTSLVQVVDDAAGVSGGYLQLNGQNQWVVSTAFVVPTTTQSLQFDYSAWATRSAYENTRLFVEALSGSAFDTTTLVGVAYGTQTQGWKHAILDLQAFQGKTIRLRLRVDDDWERGGRVWVDNLAFHVDVPGWTPSDTNRVQIATDAPLTQGSHLFLNGQNQSALSTPFRIPPDAQSLHLDFMAWATRNSLEQSRLFVEAFSGADFGTYTLIGTVGGSAVQGWQTATIDVQALQGEVIKLRLRADNDWERGGRARVDNLTLYRAGTTWDVSGAAVAAIASAPSPTLPSATSPANVGFDNGRQALASQSYPANANFVMERQALDPQTYPANAQFEQGGFAGWTISDPNVVTVQQDESGISGAYARLNGQNHWMRSQTFTIPADAQSLRFDYRAWATRNPNEWSRIFVEALSGPNFTVTTLIGVMAGTETQGWKQAVVDVQALQGQAIQLRLRVDNDWDRGGRAMIDNLSLHVEVPAWRTSDASVVQIVNDAAGVDGAYARLNGQNHWMRSQTFIIPAEAQSIRFDYRAWATRNPNEGSRIFVEALSGPNFAITTLISVVSGTETQGWKQAVVDVQALQGQAIQLRLRVDDDWDRGGRAMIDNLSLHVEVPAWRTSDASVVQVISDGTGSSGNYALVRGSNQWLTSIPFVLPATAQQVQFTYAVGVTRNDNESGALLVDVLSGANDSIVTYIGAVTGTTNQGWQQGAVSLQAFQRQAVKLRFRTESSGGDRVVQARLDSIAIVEGGTASTGSAQTAPTGPLLRLQQQNASATSNWITVPNTAEHLELQYQAWATRNAQEASRLYIEAFSTDDARVVTPLATVTGASTEGWKTASVDISQFRGRNVQLRLRADDDWDRGGRATIGNVQLTGTTDGPALGGDAYVGAFVRLDGANQSIVSSPFLVSTTVPTVTVDYAARATRNAAEQTRIFVEVFSGPAFTTYTHVTTLVGSALSGWIERMPIYLGAFAGQTVKLRLRADDDYGRGPVVNVANLQAEENEVPDPSSAACETPFAVPYGTGISRQTPAVPYVIRYVVGNVLSYVQLAQAGGDLQRRLYVSGDMIGGALPLNTQLQFQHRMRVDPGQRTPKDIFVEFCKFQDWQSLMSYRPPTDQQNRFLNRKLSQLTVRDGITAYPRYGQFQKIEDGVGQVNVDYYRVEMTEDSFPFTVTSQQLPGIPTSITFANALEFADYIRKNISRFSGDITFSPYTVRYSHDNPEGDDATRWQSANPDEALISINLAPNFPAPLRDGSVFAANYRSGVSDNHYTWRFLTVETPGDFRHPIAGVREFGMFKEGSKWTFYTRGADRIYDNATSLGSEFAFKGGDNLWNFLMNNVASVVRNPTNPDKVTVPDAVSQRYQWTPIQATYWQPTTPWVIKP